MGAPIAESQNKTGTEVRGNSTRRDDSMNRPETSQTFMRQIHSRPGLAAPARPPQPRAGPELVRELVELDMSLENDEIRAQIPVHVLAEQVQEQEQAYLLLLGASCSTHGQGSRR